MDGLGGSRYGESKIMTVMQRAVCRFTGHQWFEHWNATRIDRCLRCGVERAHETKGCGCTVCRFPGGLEGWVQWCSSVKNGLPVTSSGGK